MYHPGVGPSDRIACLLIRDGILWVGTSRGLYRFDRGHFVTVIPDESISTMDQTSDGHLLIITGHGFVEWDGARILRYPELPRQLGVHSDGIFQVHEDRNRVRWFCTSAGIARLVNGSFQKLAPYGNSGEGRPFGFTRTRREICGPTKSQDSFELATRAWKVWRWACTRGTCTRI